MYVAAETCCCCCCCCCCWLANTGGVGATAAMSVFQELCTSGEGPAVKGLPTLLIWCCRYVGGWVGGWVLWIVDHTMLLVDHTIPYM
jgi:hypothetical protein